MKQLLRQRIFIANDKGCLFEVGLFEIIDFHIIFMEYCLLKRILFEKQGEQKGKDVALVNRLFKAAD